MKRVFTVFVEEYIEVCGDKEFVLNQLPHHNNDIETLDEAIKDVLERVKNNYKSRDIVSIIIPQYTDNCFYWSGWKSINEPKLWKKRG